MAASPSAGSGAQIVVRAGRPLPHELAALVAALATVASPAPAGPAPVAWRRAARLEALGAAPVASPAQLRDAQRHR